MFSSSTTTPIQSKGQEKNPRLPSHSTFKINFSLLSFHNQRYHHVFEVLVILIEYLQLISQTLLFRTNISEDPDLDTYGLVCRAFIYVARLTNPSCLLVFPAQNSLIKTALCLVTACMFIKYFIFLYVVWVSVKNKSGSAFLIHVWKYIFKLQGRVFYYLLSSFWLNTIVAASQSKDEYFGMDSTIPILVSSILAVLEFAFTFYLNIFYCYVLPTKNFSASKDNQLELITLLQKFTLQIFQVSLFQNGTATDWTLNIVSLTFCLLRDRQFFTNLPLYNLRSLTFQVILLALVTSLNLSSFLQVLVKSFTFPQADIRLILVLWGIIAIMGIFIFINMLLRTVLSITIIANPNLSSTKLLIHKIRLLKYLRKIKRLPTSFNDKYQWEDLILTTANLSLETLYFPKNSAAQPSPVDLNIKQSADSIFAYYLDHLHKKFPQDSFVKLYLAYHGSKKHKAFGKAMKMIAELQQKASTSIISLNSSLLAHEVQDIIRKEYENSQNTSVDLSAYIKNQAYLDDLKKYMLVQADLQIKMCQEMSQDTTDLIKIWDFAISADQYRQVLQRKIKKMSKIVSESNIEPFLLCANYQLTLNNSVHEYLAHYKAYTKKLHTYEKSFQEQTLMQQNIYQEGNAFIIISGQKPDAGKILYCNKQTKNILGGDEQSYVGTNIASIFLPKTDSFSDQFFKAIIEGGDIHNLTNVVRAYVHHKEGYMIEVDYYINIHPNITQGFHLSLIVRPVPTPKDHLIVLENGDIEGMTYKLCRKLRLLKNFHPNSRKALNISSLSFELMRVNRAFSALSQVKKTSLYEVINKNRRKNFVRLATTHENSTKLLIDEESSDDLNPALNHHQLHEHKEVYSTYSVEGAEVTLHSFDSNNVETLTYHCKAKNLNFTSTSVLLLTLEEAQRAKKDSPSFDLQKFITTSKTDNHKNFSTNNALSEEKLPPYESINEYSITLQVEDEKQGGWIDFKLLQASQRDKMELYSKREFTGTTAKLDKIDETDQESLVSPKSPKSFGFLNSIRSQGMPLISMASPGRLQRKLTTTNHRLFTTQISQILPPAAGRSSETGHIPSSQEQNGVHNKAIVGSIQTSQISKKSTHKRISKVIKLALETQYYSRTFKIICGFFYFLILCIFASQVYLKITIGNTTTLLDTKKSILINAQLRAYQLTNIQSIFRQMEDLSTGRLTEADLGLVARPLSTYVSLSKGYLENLVELNRQILTSISALNQETRAPLFLKDVKVYETKTDPTGTVYTLMTNFEATERIIESASKELQDCATNTTHTLEEFNFVSRNTINDLYFKNNDISDLFLESVQDQIGSIQDEITIYLILEFVLLIIICATVLHAVRQQYLKETKYMTAFVKPANKEILTMIHNLNIFKREIENQKENSFDQRLRTDELAPYSKHLSKQSTSPSYNKFSAKRESMRVAKHAGIQKKYLAYLLKWFLLTAVLIALVVWNSVLAKVSTQYTQTKVTQLDFTYRMETSIDLAVVVASELPIGNGTTIIQNVSTSTGIANSIKVVQNLITQVTQIIGRSDLADNPEVDIILFSDTCQFLDSSFFQYYCTILKEKGIGTGFLQLLSKLESLLAKREENFFDSDRSAAALKTIELIDYDIIIAVKRGLLGGTGVLGDLINRDFEDYSNRTTRQRTVIFGLFTGYLCVLVFSAWFAILKKINEGDNDFKKVLKSLPPELILPNFILKSFLLKTSQGIIDTVKADI